MNHKCELSKLIRSKQIGSKWMKLNQIWWELMKFIEIWWKLIEWNWIWSFLFDCKVVCEKGGELRNELSQLILSKQIGSNWIKMNQIWWELMRFDENWSKWFEFDHFYSIFNQNSQLNSKGTWTVTINLIETNWLKVDEIESNLMGTDETWWKLIESICN